jgi:hypothetical protein
VVIGLVAFGKASADSRHWAAAFPEKDGSSRIGFRG